MTFVARSTVTLATDASSGSTQYSDTLNGLLHAFSYVRDSTGTALSTTMGLTITGEDSGITFFALSPFNSTIDAVFMPRGPVHISTAGTTAAGVDRLPVCNERLKLVCSSGGASKSGTFKFFMA